MVSCENPERNDYTKMRFDSAYFELSTPVSRWATNITDTSFINRFFRNLKRSSETVSDQIASDSIYSWTFYGTGDKIIITLFVNSDGRLVVLDANYFTPPYFAAAKYFQADSMNWVTKYTNGLKLKKLY